MPLHDWTRVEAGIFHDFHTVWIGEIRTALNDHLLPSGYYALAEQHAGQFLPDVVTLHVPPTQEDLQFAAVPLPDSAGGVAVAEAPPKVQSIETVQLPERQLRRTLAIRHISNHRIVAMLEIVSPGNKDRAEQIAALVNKTVTAIQRGIHVLLIDLYPPGKYDPIGLHALVRQNLLVENELPESLSLERPSEPAVLVSYAVGRQLDMYIERVALNQPLPEMPIFLTADRYINVPLEATYLATWRGMPKFWKQVLEGEPV